MIFTEIKFDFVFRLFYRDTLNAKPTFTKNKKTFAFQLREKRKAQLDESIVSDEVAHDEPPHLDLRCMQIQLSLTLLTTKTQTTKFTSANFQKLLGPSYIILKIQLPEGIQCRSI